MLHNKNDALGSNHIYVIDDLEWLNRREKLETFCAVKPAWWRKLD